MVDVDAPLNGAPGYGVFRTADDVHVAVGIMNEDHFWVGLCRALDLTEHEQLTNNERNMVFREVNAAIGEAISRLSLSEALDVLARHDVPASPVLTQEEMLQHPHFRERGTVVDGPDGRPRSGPLVRFEQSPGRPPFGAPPAGSDHPGWLDRR
jgi:crotonobetainyl-CoA:carnitine CoA-transferase CaiB-like acyl-CoA transferase